MSDARPDDNRDSGSRPPVTGGPSDDLAPRVQHWSHHLEQAADPFHDAVVLVVDDNKANILLVQRILTGAGVSNVHTVLDSRHAVEQCVQLRPDLILLDLHMPHLDGFGVLAALEAALPEEAFLPVIVLTADASATTRERALDAGAKDFLTKPFDRTEVLQRARNLLRTRALYQGIQREHQRLQRELNRQLQAQQQRDADHALLRDRIAAVLRDGGPRMVFQPIVDLSTGHTVGVEALARFDSEPYRTPDVWFVDAADVGLGAELEIAAIRAAIAHLPDLPSGLFLTVNASPATLTNHALLESISHRVAPRLVIELTEHDDISDYPALLAALDILRGHGMRVAVDDAGAGYAGLRQILHLRPDIIKLDIELTRDIDHDPVRRALAAALVTFANDTAAVILAEGIETEAELHTLDQLGVPWGQGYHLGRPGALPTSQAEPTRSKTT